MFHRLRATVGEAVAGNVDRSGVGGDHTEEHQQRRRLAGTVGTQQAKSGTSRHR
ncbi:MAG: hypothetical protein WD313_00920 [Acidimicrobiia bacterium]